MTPDAAPPTSSSELLALVDGLRERGVFRLRWGALELDLMESAPPADASMPSADDLAERREQNRLERRRVITRAGR